MNLAADLRAFVRERARGYCEYCRVHEDAVLFPHEADHIIAEQHGGPTTPSNLALACSHCNRFKGPNIASVDPTTSSVVSLFHPRNDFWLDHFRLEGARIIGLTPTGRATVALLKLNASERLRVRECVRQSGSFP
jgi:hypothetical protein